ncbi:hypothetical protein [Georgenia alba]|uniref:DUF624 domain-containing protein n=1 Tax=Georgenia alba TaxID=2233858 RepID=A0ABW2QAR1_9MICO
MVASGVYRVLDTTWTLARLGLVWWLCLLLIVPAPAATVWLLHAARGQLRGEVAQDLGTTLRYIARMTLPALRLGLIHLGLAVVTVSALLGPSPGGVLDVVLPPVAVGVTLTWLLVLPWSFVALEQDPGAGALDALRHAYRWALAHLLAAALTCTALAAAALLMWSVPAEVVLLPGVALPAVLALTVRSVQDRAESHPHARRTRV